MQSSGRIRGDARMIVLFVVLSCLILTFVLVLKRDLLSMTS